MNNRIEKNELLIMLLKKVLQLQKDQETNLSFVQNNMIEISKSSGVGISSAFIDMVRTSKEIDVLNQVIKDIKSYDEGK